MDCGQAVAAFGLSLTMDVMGAKAVFAAGRLGVQGVALAAKSWNPSLVRELGRAAAYARQQALSRGATMAGTVAAPELSGHFLRMARAINGFGRLRVR